VNTRLRVNASVGNDFRRKKIMKGKVIPIDEALAGSDTDGCWVLV
jgi:hypothetical protein